MENQMMMTANDDSRKHGDELDKDLHECMSDLWRAYRLAVTGHNAKPFNDCFPALYAKHKDKAVVQFVECMGMGLVDALNRHIQEDGK